MTKTLIIRRLRIISKLRLALSIWTKLKLKINEYRQFVNDMNDQSPDWATDKDKLYENFKYSKNQTTGKEGARDSIIDYITATYDSKYIPMNPSDPIKKDAAQDITAQNFYSFIYPDTLVWRREFTFAYNEPLTENYWWHPAYDNYPVVGVSWHAAQAFCVWRTILFNNNRAKIKRPALPRFRLPPKQSGNMPLAEGLSTNYIHGKDIT
jgi:hypothetical protein